MNGYVSRYPRPTRNESLLAHLVNVETNIQIQFSELQMVRMIFVLPEGSE
jgi:hypothetical protein